MSERLTLFSPIWHVHESPTCNWVSYWTEQLRTYIPTLTISYCFVSIVHISAQIIDHWQYIMRLPSTLDPNGPLDSTYVQWQYLLSDPMLHWLINLMHRIGPLYLGVVISAMLYGLCLLQAFLYFQSVYQSQCQGLDIFLTEAQSTSKILGTSKSLSVFWMKFTMSKFSRSWDRWSLLSYSMPFIYPWSRREVRCFIKSLGSLSFMLNFSVYHYVIKNYQ